MTFIEKHAPGSICWIELASSDQAAAKNFYTSLFGWTPEDFPTAPGESYTLFRLQGRDVGGGYSLRADQKERNVSPHWLMYVAVESADKSVKRATDLGATVLAGPFDAGDFGRMAVLMDPMGAPFAIWEAMKHPGIGIMGEDGTLSWADLSSPDPQRAGKFYSDLFDWQMVTNAKDPEHDYIHIKNGEHFIGGIPPARDRQPNTPPHWLIYLHTSDCDAFAGKAKQLGANFYLPPTTMENVGRMAVVADPQGAVFAMFQPMPKISG